MQEIGRLSSESWLAIGRRHWVPVSSLAEASAIYQRLRDESGEGASTFPFGKVHDAGGGANYVISYNGRVWRGGTSRNSGAGTAGALVMEAVSCR